MKLNLEKTRRKVKALRFFIGLNVAALVLAFIISIPVFVAGIIVLTILGLAYYRIKAQYDAAFKEQVVQRELESFLENTEFSPGRTLDESIVRECRLFKRYDAYSGNDYLSAGYKNIRFIQSNIHLQEEYEINATDSEGDIDTEEGYNTVFRGRLTVFDYDAGASEPVYVFDKRMKRVESILQTEFEAFNKTFGITAKDALTAYIVLTPQVIEGIALASDKLKYPMALAFSNGKIYIAIESGDAFEKASTGGASIAEQRARVRREIEAVLDLAETICLKK